MKKPEISPSPSPAKSNGLLNRARNGLLSVFAIASPVPTAENHELPEEPDSFAHPAIQPEKISEDSRPKQLADFLNFLAKSSYAFSDKTDFLDKLMAFVTGDRQDGSASPIPIDHQTKTRIRIEILHFSGTQGKTPVPDFISDERFMACLRACNGDPRREEAMKQILTDIQSLVRSVYGLLPNPGEKEASSFRERMIKMASEHPQLRKEVLFPFRKFRQRVLAQKEASGSDPATLSFKDFLLNERSISKGDLFNQLPELLQEGSLKDLDLTFPKGDWIHAFVEVGVARERQKTLKASVRSRVRETLSFPAPIAEPATIELTTDHLGFHAPRASEAIQSLIVLKNTPGSDSVLLPLVSALFMDLGLDLGPDAIRSLSEVADILPHIHTRFPTMEHLTQFLAGLETHFRKSSSHNPDLWLLICSSKKPYSAFTIDKIQAFYSRRFARSHEAMILLKPTEQDIENILHSFYSLRPGDFPKELVYSIFSLYPNELDILRIQEFLSAPDQSHLIRKAIENCATLILSKENVPEVADELFPDILESFKQGTRHSVMEMVSNHHRIRSRKAFEHSTRSADRLIQSNRTHALAHMARFEGLLPHEAPHRLSDEEYGARFRSTEAGFYSTNFDLAQVGLTDLWLKNAAGGYVFQDENGVDSPSVDQKTNFAKIRQFCVNGILNTLAPARDPGSADYSPDHFYFSKSGTSAFELVSEHMAPGDVVLSGCEEYRHLQSVMAKRGVETVPMPDLRGIDPLEHQKQLLRIINENERIRFMLVSDVTRRGSLMPLEAFADIRRYFQDLKRPLYLLQDGCQSFGRRVSLLTRAMPDAYFTSGFKGADAGGGGFAILSNSFIKSIGMKQITGGSDDPDLMTRLLIAANPMALGLRDTLLTLPQREAALRDLSCKFVQMVHAINAHEPGRIHWVYPSHDILDANHNPIPEKMTGVFECEIRGLSRAQVSRFAARFGVHIAPTYADPASDASFRIAFHPHMGNESILILGYVLAHCGKA